MYAKTIVIGKLGRDPEMRYTADGTAVTSFSVAANRTYTRHDKKVTETTWFRVTVWGKQAEACQEYLRKGSLVMCEGTLTPDPETGGPKIWSGDDGKARANFELNATICRFLTSSGRKETDAEREQQEEEW